MKKIFILCQRSSAVQISPKVVQLNVHKIYIAILRKTVLTHFVLAFGESEALGDQL